MAGIAAWQCSKVRNGVIATQPGLAAIILD